MDLQNGEKYQYISKYTLPVMDMTRPVIGREKELRTMKAALSRKELCNVLLLAEPGTGKTALVQAMKKEFQDACFRELNLSLVSADFPDGGAFGNCLKDLFREISNYTQTEHVKMILFIDEFHQIVQLSASGVEAMKPILADSGRRHLRIIAATTYKEFLDYLAPNQALIERLQRINLKQPTTEVTVQILESLAKTYGVDTKITKDTLREIVQYTDRYIPANAQPRKSLLVLDAMCGWNTAYNIQMNHDLLRQVIEESEGIRVDVAVNPYTVKEYIDHYVIAQSLATSTIAEYLQICVANLSAPGRPLASFLFTGSTGVGKTEVVKRLSEKLFGKPNDQLIRFDMTEYANAESVERFRTELTRQVWAHPHCIVLLDEIEKAAKEITKILLPVLDDGRLIDENNREVVFTNSYIVMTTNAGSEIYSVINDYMASDTGDGAKLKKLQPLIRRSISQTAGEGFPPELLGRIDAIVPFQPLSEDTKRKIVDMKLNTLKERVKKEHNIRLTISPRVGEYLVANMAMKDSDGGGARNLNSIINSQITARVATLINTSTHKIRRMTVDFNGKMASELKNSLKDEGYIDVHEG